MTFTAYVVKYALTVGIQKVQVEDCFNVSPLMIKVGNSYYHRGDWVTDPAEALRLAEDMRMRKLQSLEKSLKKVSALVFTVPS